MSSQLGHMTNIYGFLSTCIIPITAKLDILVDTVHWYYLVQMMVSPQLGHVCNVLGFISPFINPLITKIGSMADQHAFILPWQYDEVITAISLYERLCLYIYSSKPYKNEAWQDGRLACTNVILLKWWPK